MKHNDIRNKIESSIDELERYWKDKHDKMVDAFSAECNARINLQEKYEKLLNSTIRN